MPERNNIIKLSSTMSSKNADTEAIRAGVGFQAVRLANADRRGVRRLGSASRGRRLRAGSDLSDRRFVATIVQTLQIA